MNADKEAYISATHQARIDRDYGTWLIDLKQNYQQAQLPTAEQLQAHIKLLKDELKRRRKS